MEDHKTIAIPGPSHTEMRPFYLPTVCKWLADGYRVVLPIHRTGCDERISGRLAGVEVNLARDTAILTVVEQSQARHAHTLHVYV